MSERTRKVAWLAALTLAASISAYGQRGSAGHTMGSPGRGVSGPGRSLVAPGRRILGTAPGVSPGFLSRPLVGTALNPNFAPIRGVPGLGFDYQHLAAIEHPFRNRFGRGRGFFPYYPYFAPLFFDTLPLDYYPSDNEYPYGSQVPDYYTSEAQQPQFLIPQPGSLPPAPAPDTAALTPASPPPELGQLILVRRDGQVLLAVAFTVRNGQITYITQDGARRSFPLPELDKDATRQMNDANGTSVSLPD